MADDAPPNPWTPGRPARVASPDNPRHPRAGRVGRVLEARWTDAVVKSYRGESRVIEPACFMVRVRFKIATWADWRARGEIDDVWTFFERELQ